VDDRCKKQAACRNIGFPKSEFQDEHFWDRFPLSRWPVGLLFYAAPVCVGVADCEFL
jgi:hypothetical protein